MRKILSMMIMFVLIILPASCQKSLGLNTADKAAPESIGYFTYRGLVYQEFPADKNFSLDLSNIDDDTTKITITNNSSHAYNEVLLELIFLSDDNQLQYSYDAGVYTPILPNEKIYLYLDNFDQMLAQNEITQKITQAHVINVIENYFSNQHKKIIV